MSQASTLHSVHRNLMVRATAVMLVAVILAFGGYILVQHLRGTDGGRGTLTPAVQVEHGLNADSLSGYKPATTSGARGLNSDSFSGYNAVSPASLSGLNADSGSGY